MTTSGGPNTVTVGFGHESVTLDQNAIDILLTGDDGPLGEFSDVVEDLEIKPEDLGRYLDGLL